jgi:excalibur calcium-binding domain-containing protein
MRKPAKIALSIFGSFVAIIVIAGVANAGNAAPASAPASTPATSTAAATPTTTPPPTATAAAPVAPTADELFVAAVVDTHELVGVGRSICDSIGTPDVTHASLVAEFGASKWGAAVAEAVVASAEHNLCPERQFFVPPVSVPSVTPAPPAPAPQPRPTHAPQPAPQPEPKREPARAPAPRDEAPSPGYFKNCDAARAAGAAPLHAGEPGYRAALDRDKDGTACE